PRRHRWRPPLREELLALRELRLHLRPRGRQARRALWLGGQPQRAEHRLHRNLLTQIRIENAAGGTECTQCRNTERPEETLETVGRRLPPSDGGTGFLTRSGLLFTHTAQRKHDARSAPP